MTDEILPFITVVMPIRNEERFIASTLKQIVSQDYPVDRYEIIVADGMSDDRTREIIHEISLTHKNICLMDNVKKLSSAGRNVGFQNGRGDVYLVIDGHCYIPDNQLFRSIVECLKKSNADCLGRPQFLDPPDISDFQKAVAWARNSVIGHGNDSLIYSEYEGFVNPVSNGAIYTKNVFTKIGYVDEAFDACEDVEFNHRVNKAGLKAYMSPKLTVKYYPREDLKGLFRQMNRYGLGRMKFIKKHPEAFSSLFFIPFFFTIGLLLLVPLSFAHKFFKRIMVIIYGTYLVLILLYSLMISISRGLKYFRYLLPIFFTIHYGLGWGVLKYLKNKINKF
jgi:succinoglycan biosynthesis protein ExoA